MSDDHETEAVRPPPFSAAEFTERVARLGAALEQRSLDALLITSQANFDYFTGFLVAHPWASLSRNIVAVVTREGQASLIVPSFMEGEARAGSWIEDVRLHEATGSAPIDAIASACRTLDLGSARIGAELGREQRVNLSQVDFSRLERALQPATLVDASDAIWDIRIVKSPAEIARLRHACTIAGRVFERVFSEVSGGMTERQIAHRVRQLMLEEGADEPGWVMMTSGPGEYHRTFGTARDRVLEPGDMVFMDICVLIDGYGSDFGRAGVVGEPTAEQLAAQAAAIAATEAGVAAVGPGTPVADVAEAAIRSLARSGFPLQAPGRIGHGLGLLSTEPPDISKSDLTVLRPGMVITIEPTIIRGDGIFQAEENVAVLADGCEVLSRSPAHLRCLPVARADAQHARA